MKLLPLMLGLGLAAALDLLAGAPAKDVQLSSPARKESPSLSDKKQGSAPEGPVVDSGRRGGLEDTVEILSVKEGKPDAEGRRKVTVRVRYALVHYQNGILSLGFNLKSATQFARVADAPVDAGSEEIELSAVIVPVAWPKAQPFKASVGLSAEPHPKQWSLLAAVTQVMKPIAVPVAAKSDAPKK